MTSLQKSSKDTTVGFTDEELDAMFADCAPGSDGLATSNLQMTEFVSFDDWLFGGDCSPDISFLTTNLQMTGSSPCDSSREDRSPMAKAPSSNATATPTSPFFPPAHGWSGQMSGALYNVSTVQDENFGESGSCNDGLLDYRWKDPVNQPINTGPRIYRIINFTCRAVSEVSHAGKDVPVVLTLAQGRALEFCPNGGQGVSSPLRSTQCVTGDLADIETTALDSENILVTKLRPWKGRASSPAKTDQIKRTRRSFTTHRSRKVKSVREASACLRCQMLHEEVSYQ